MNWKRGVFYLSGFVVGMLMMSGHWAIALGITVVAMTCLFTGALDR